MAVTLGNNGAAVSHLLQSPMAAETPRPTFVQFVAAERTFLVVLMTCFLVAALTYQTPQIAMWVGFAFAGYSAVANDSIQTLGTFIASNRDQKWWHLWLYIGGIFIVTMVFGWFRYDGDISYQRLTSKGFEVAPTEFTFLKIAAPLFLLILTRLRMPVSTSILLLSCFVTAPKGITSVIMKSVGGYGIAFVASIVIWGTLGRWMQKRFTGKPHWGWRIFQLFTSGSLWAVWLAQDAANIAVYLPRQLDVSQLVLFLVFIFFGLGILFYQRGEKVQGVVEEKSAVADIRPASIIDLVYGIILAWKITSSPVPMSTTWVFIGLLGGRELALTWTKSIPGRSVGGALAMMTRDLMTVAAGLIISLGLAVVINPIVRHAWLPFTMDVEESACAHFGAGEVVPATGAADAAAAAAEDSAAILESHVQYDLALSRGDSYFVFESGGGATHIILSDAVAVQLLDADGEDVALDDHGSSDTCAPLDAWFSANLAAGAYTIVLDGPVLDLGLLIED